MSAVCSAALTAPLSLAITSGGVPAGANRPVQALVAKSGKPLSIIVGTSGSSGLRCALVTASARSCPVLISGSSTEMPSKVYCT